MKFYSLLLQVVADRSSYRHVSAFSCTEDFQAINTVDWVILGKEDNNDDTCVRYWYCESGLWQSLTAWTVFNPT